MVQNWEVHTRPDSERGARMVKFNHSIREIKYDKYVDYDLFPYDMKDRSKFLEHENHPKGLNPNSFAFKSYWKEFAGKCVEGKWVNDKGTWVFMMPELFYYINYLIYKCITSS